MIGLSSLTPTDSPAVRASTTSSRSVPFATPDPKTASLWPSAALVALCTALPLALHLAGAFREWRNPRPAPLDEGASDLRGMLLPILQAVWVGLQITLLVRLAFWASPSSVWGPLLAASVVTFLHAVHVADQLLVSRLGLRFSWHFLSYLACFRLFAQSIRHTGVPVGRLSVATSMYGVLILLLLLGVRRALDFPISPPYGLLAAVVLGAVMLALAERSLPGSTDWRTSNIIFTTERDGLIALLRRPEPLPEVGSDLLIQFSPNEVFSDVSPTNPLLRRTHSYGGDPVVDLDLSSARPHVILVFLESFCASATGVIGGDIGASPEFDRLARQGILYRHFQGNGIQTARAVVSSLFGIPPRFTETPVQADVRRCPRLVGLPQFFREMGYANGYFHSGSLGFERQDVFFSRNGYDELHGDAEIRSQFPEATLLGGWGVPDEFLMRYFVRWLDGRARQGTPTFSTLFTMTNHHPFEIPGGFVAPAFQFPGNPEKELFLRTFYYTDHCLGLLMRLLEERGLDRQSLIVVLADTPQPLGEHENWTEQIGLFEENLRIPLLILPPTAMRRPRVIDTPCSQLDLIPTFVDLFRRSFRHHGLGTSLLRRVNDRTICFNNPFGPRTVGERRGRYKLLHEIGTGNTFLYDLESDPFEERNLALNDPAHTKTWLHDMLKRHTLVQHLYQRDRFC